MKELFFYRKFKKFPLHFADVLKKDKKRKSSKFVSIVSQKQLLFYATHDYILKFSKLYYIKTFFSKTI